MKKKSNLVLQESNSLIFIPNNVPSLKNSKVKATNGIFMSKTVKKYLGLLGIQTYSASRKEVKGYVKRPNEFEKIREQFENQKLDKNIPYLLGYHFVRSTKRDFDFNNATQIIQDLLVAHDMFEDDCTRITIPIPIRMEGEFYTVDKENPGVYLKIISHEEYNL